MIFKRGIFNKEIRRAKITGVIALILLVAFLIYALVAYGWPVFFLVITGAALGLYIGAAGTGYMAMEVIIAGTDENRHSGVTTLDLIDRSNVAAAVEE